MAEYFYKDGDEYKKVDENLLAQADVDKVVESRLERQKKQYADYDDLKEKAGKVDTVTKDFEDKLKVKDTEIETVKGDLGKAKLETSKVKIIHEFKLSDELAEFVDGDTEDAIRAKAEKLSKGIGTGGVKIDKKPKPGTEETQTKKMANDLFGKNKSDD